MEAPHRHHPLHTRQISQRRRLLRCRVHKDAVEQMLNGARDLNGLGFNLRTEAALHVAEVLPVDSGGGPRLLDAPRESFHHRGLREKQHPFVAGRRRRRQLSREHEQKENSTTGTEHKFNGRVAWASGDRKSADRALGGSARRSIRRHAMGSARMVMVAFCHPRVTNPAASAPKRFRMSRPWGFGACGAWAGWPPRCGVAARAGGSAFVSPSCGLHYHARKARTTQRGASQGRWSWPGARERGARKPSAAALVKLAHGGTRESSLTAATWGRARSRGPPARRLSLA